MQTLDPLNMPLRGHHLIEASAGTGKTYTIGSLVLRLLLGHECGSTGTGTAFGIEQLLIVTFTNAASEELLARIRQRIEQAADAFDRCWAGDDEFLESLLSASDDPIRDRDRLRLALASLDLASVFTIHGFAQRMLRRFAFESGSSFTAELDESSQDLLFETVLDFWRQRVYPLDTLASDRIHDTYPTPTQLARAVAELMKKDGLQFVGEPTASWEELALGIDKGREDLAQYWRDNADTMREQLAGVEIKAPRRYRVEAALDALGNAEVSWQEIALLLSLPDLPAKEFKQVSSPFPRQWPLLPLLQELLDWGNMLSARLLLDSYAYCRVQLPQRKRRADRMGFDDLLLQLDVALCGDGGEQLAATIRAQYPIAMIDEFQDTDRLQWRVFSRLYASPDSGLILIGDPKQAIYAFRGADISAYIAARRETRSRFLLGTNFRSTAALVEAVNELFQYRDDNNPFLAGEDIPFIAVDSSGRPELQGLRQGSEVLSGLRALAPPSILKKGDFLDTMASAFADQLAGLLADGEPGTWLGERRLQAGDVAVLVRNRFEATRMQAALAHCDVPCVYQGRDSVFVDPGAMDLYHLLRAVLNPGDERALRAALASGIMQRSATELAELYGSDEQPLLVLQERFQAYADVLRQQGVLPMFRRLFHDHAVPARMLARQDGERRLTDAMHIIELLHLDGRGLESHEALLARFAEWLAEPDGDRSNQQLRLESDARRVQIVTLHKCKGLQYPVVCLPFVTDARRARVPFYHEQTTLDPVYDLAFSPTSLDLADRERLAEDVRLLYVGLTRAEHLCLLGLADAGGRGNPPLVIADSAMGHLLQIDADKGLAGALEHDRVARLLSLPNWPESSATAAGAVPPQRELSARSFNTRVLRDWQVGSYSAMMRQSQEGDHARFRQPELGGTARGSLASSGAGPDIFNFDRGARPGSFLHLLFENVNFSPDRDTAMTRRLVEQGLQREGFDTIYTPALLTMIDDVLGCDLDNRGLRLESVPAQQMRVEMGFDLAVGTVDAASMNSLFASWQRSDSMRPLLGFRDWQGLLTGFIDLVFCHQGRYYVLDYKSNHLGARVDDYGPAALEEAMAGHRYDLQYLLYLVALQRMLRQRLGTVYAYERHIGGAWYLFLRGIRRQHGAAYGVYHDRPSQALVDGLDQLLGRP